MPPIAKHFLGIAGCSGIVLAYGWLALILSFANFHPGAGGEESPEADRLTAIGYVMAQPFLFPIRCLGKMFGPGVGNWSPFIAYGLVFLYGGLLYLALRAAWRKFNSPRTNAPTNKISSDQPST